MAKKIRFPLQMNGAEVRTIEELREHFDLESVLGYFTNGKLATWLKDRYYDNEAEAVEALSADDTDLNKKLMSILGIAVDAEIEEIDLEAIQRRNEKLMQLRQITDDKEIIDNVDCVAFNQDDLNQLLKEGKKEIYLCQGEFEVLKADCSRRTFIGIDNPKLVIKITAKDSHYAFLTLKLIHIDNVEGVAEDNFDAQYNLGRLYEEKKYSPFSFNMKKAFEWYKKSAENGNVEAQYKLAICYKEGKGVKQDDVTAFEWCTRAAENGSAIALYYLGNSFYENKNNAVKRDYDKAIECYKKAADKGASYAMLHLAECYECGLYSHDRGVQPSSIQAFKWYKKAAECFLEDGSDDCYGYVYCKIAKFYEEGSQGVGTNYQLALKWYKLAAKANDTEAQERLKILGETW